MAKGLRYLTDDDASVVALLQKIESCTLDVMRVHHSVDQAGADAAFTAKMVSFRAACPVSLHYSG